MPKPKLAAEMVSGDNLTESTTSMSASKVKIDEIHDCSEQEKDAPNKTSESIKNALYEKGKFYYASLLLMSVTILQTGLQ